MVVNVRFLWLQLLYFSAGINSKIFSPGAKMSEDIILNIGYPEKFLFYLDQIFYCQKSRHVTKSSIKFERYHKGRLTFTVHHGGKSWLLVGYCYPRSIFEWYWIIKIQLQHRFLFLVIINCITWDWEIC